MNNHQLAWRISRKLGKSKEKNLRSSSLYRISQVAIGLSAAVMVLSLAVLNGFQTEIKRKVKGFVADIQILYYDNNESIETTPIVADKNLLNQIKTSAGVEHAQVFATKAGIIRKGEQMQGAVMKGISYDYDWTFYKPLLIAGKIPDFNGNTPSNDILISKKISQSLGYKIGDKLLLYFIQNPPLVRKFTVVGIYHTGLEDFDEKFIWGDIRHIRKLNQWSSDQAGGIEVKIKKEAKTEDVKDALNDIIPIETEAREVSEQFPQLFDWLKLQDINVQVIVILMTIVAVVNIITALIILIMERIKMIGLLKSLGASNALIRRVFIYRTTFLVMKGLAWGNLCAILFCLMQLKFNFLKLDETSYYVSFIPVEFNWMQIVMINVLLVIVCFISLLVPSSLVSKVDPVKAIRFS